MRRNTRQILGIVAITAFASGAVALGSGDRAPKFEPPEHISLKEHARTISAMRPQKRLHPVIAVLGQNDGTETTDYIIPYSVLTEANVGEVLAVATDDRPLKLTPALTILPQATTASFDTRYPDGADYVVVPRIDRRDDPAMLSWLRAQADKGSTIVGICAGAKTLSSAGFLKERRATGHWFDVEDLQEENPTMRFVPNRRYVADRGVVTTTGVSASLPASIALVEAIAGTDRAAAVASALGVSTWDESHNSSAFGLDLKTRLTAFTNKYLVAGGDTFGVPIEPGVDELALSFTADAWSRTYRSQALSVAPTAEPLMTRRGLTVLPDRREGETSYTRVLPPPSQIDPAHALPTALGEIAELYDKGTASFVALQLEYPWNAGMK